MKRVSILDIAQEMGMSRNTISKAIRGNDSVAPETRNRIIAKAIEMGYTKLPEEVLAEHSNEKNNKIKRILVLSKREVSEFWNRIILGITDVATENGYSCLFHFVTDDHMATGNLPADLIQKDVDGILCLNIFTQNFYQQLFELDIPMVTYDMPIDMKSSKIKADRILFEGYHNMYDLTAHLIDVGYKTLGFIGDNTFCRTVWDRWSGFNNCLIDHNMTCEDKYCETNHSPDIFYYYERFAKMMEARESFPEVFVCADDVIAMFTVQYLESKGYRVPEDVAVTGFDDQAQVMSNNIKLTTVHVDNEYLGARMTEQLMNRIKHPERPIETIFVETKIIYRDTTL